VNVTVLSVKNASRGDSLVRSPGHKSRYPILGLHGNYQKIFRLSVFGVS
jgi:hypothetical protein